MRIGVRQRAGDFAARAEIARALRTEEIEPSLRSGDRVELDFGGVRTITAEFADELLAPLLRDADLDALGLLVFERCEEAVREAISAAIEAAGDK